MDALFAIVTAIAAIVAVDLDVIPWGTRRSLMDARG